MTVSYKKDVYWISTVFPHRTTITKSTVNDTSIESFKCSTGKISFSTLQHHIDLEALLDAFWVCFYQSRELSI